MKHAFFSFYESIKQKISESFSEHLTEQYTWAILSHVFSRSKTELIAHSPEITDLHKQQVDHLLYELITLHKPIAYIVSSVPFLDLHLIARPPVLIPRPETEYLISKLITMLKPFEGNALSILDIGTGSGCIALSFAYYFPKFSVTATDISDAALSLCHDNAKKHNIKNVIIKKSDLFFNIDKKDFDLIVSNPPYISESELQYLDQSVKYWEDHQALVAGKDGLSLLSKIIKAAPAYTHKNSILAKHNMPQLVVEIGHKQTDRVSDLIQKAGYHHVMVWKDQYNKNRAIFGASL